MFENIIQCRAIIEGHRGVICLLFFKKMNTENFCLPWTSHISAILKGQNWFSLKRTLIFSSRHRGLNTSHIVWGGRVWKGDDDLARSRLYLHVAFLCQPVVVQGMADFGSWAFSLVPASTWGMLFILAHLKSGDLYPLWLLSLDI